MADAPVDQSAPPLLVFVHIPKTGGTTLRTVLEMNEPGERTRALSNVFKGGGGFDEELIERLREGRGPNLKATRVLRGHFPLGIREFLPSYLAKGREVLCFSLLREPVDRSLSHYFQIRENRQGSQRRSKFARSRFPARATMDDMLEAGYIHDNLQTRMLSGHAEPFGEVSDEMLEHAKRNLSEGLVFFGLTERFDESLVLAKQRLGFSSILYEADDRVNATRPRGDEIPDELIEAAQRCNRFDIELYRHAEALFERAPERGQLEFEVEFTALRAARAKGEIRVDSPPPAGFAGDEQEWRMLLHARATLLRHELEHARTRIPGVAITVQHKALEKELKTARARTQELEREVERLHAVSSKAKQREAKRAQTASAKTEELGQRLRAARSRARALEQEVKRLRAAGERLQGEAVGESGKARARARSRPKRDSRRGGEKAGGSRPTRDSKRGGAKGRRPKRDSKRGGATSSGAAGPKARGNRG